MAEQVKTLVVNADDFGLSESINRGILSAHQNGILRSTSLMPNGSAFDDAVRIALDTPTLGVGIHISLVAERCVAPIEKLNGLVSSDGLLPESYIAFVKGYLKHRFGLKEIKSEIEAQVSRFLASGINPTHIDAHQHLHVLPGVFDIVLNAASASNIKVIRIPLERGGPGSRGLNSKVLSLFCRIAARKAQRAGIHIVDSFWGFNVSGNMNEANLASVLKLLRPGVNEIMCHPGISDPVTAARYPWGYSWDDELAALQSDAIRHYIEENNIRLANFAEAWA